MRVIYVILMVTRLKGIYRDIGLITFNGNVPTVLTSFP